MRLIRGLYPGQEGIAPRKHTMLRIKASSILAVCLILLQFHVTPIMGLAKAADQPPANGGLRFQFISDGPLSQVWGRAEEIPRKFFPERLPAFFSKTIALDNSLPRDARLSWIFTGKEGGFTIEISQSLVRVYQRFYDSYGLIDSHTTNPERVVQEMVATVPAEIHSVTVVLDAHLSLSVHVNGTQVIQQNCLMDVDRHQLLFQGPRTRHIVLTGVLLATPTTDAAVSIDTTHRHQIIYGFGGSPSIPAYLRLSDAGKKRYWHILARYNLLIDREYPMGTSLLPDMSNLDNPADAKPHYYGDDFPNGELSSFAYNTETLKLAGKVIYEQWALPAWETKDYTGPDGEEHKGVANPAEWARAMVTYARMEKERTGRAPDVIGIQNEIQQPKEITFAMIRILRRELDAAGFKDVKIHMPDASYVALGIEVANMLRSDTKVWSKIDIAASHEYDFQDHFADPDSFDDQFKALRQAYGDKPFLATEISVNNVRLQSSSYRVAFNVGQLYHKNMTLMDAIGLGYCWLILDVEQPNFGATRSLLVPDRFHGDVPVASSNQLRVLGAYSRHLREGMVRVDASSTDADLLVSAYEGKDRMRTVIATNRSTSPQSLTVKWPGTTWSEMERVSQYDENRREAGSTQTVIQPGEIVIFSTLVLPPAD
jgi:O-glycosyl hydrolase